MAEHSTTVTFKELIRCRRWCSLWDGQPAKNNYRKYKLDADKTHNGADEVANTREVIRRRYTRLLKERVLLPD